MTGNEPEGIRSWYAAAERNDATAADHGVRLAEERVIRAYGVLEAAERFEAPERHAPIDYVAGAVRWTLYKQRLRASLELLDAALERRTRAYVQSDS